MSEITPEVVRNYKEFTPKFLCGLSANVYNIKFKRFKVRDIETDFVLFDVSDESEENQDQENKDIPDEMKDENLKKIEDEDIYKSPRMIRYHLGPDFLDLKNRKII